MKRRVIVGSSEMPTEAAGRLRSQSEHSFPYNAFEEPAGSKSGVSFTDIRSFRQMPP
jgi:hypothetical protein